MKKYQAIIKFTMDDNFMTLIPPHRTYINYLINNNVIDIYAVSMESQTVWITIYAMAILPDSLQLAVLCQH